MSYCQPSLWFSVDHFHNKQNSIHFSSAIVIISKAPESSFWILSCKKVPFTMPFRFKHILYSSSLWIIYISQFVRVFPFNFNVFRAFFSLNLIMRYDEWKLNSDSFSFCINFFLFCYVLYEGTVWEVQLFYLSLFVAFLLCIHVMIYVILCTIQCKE